MFQRGSPTTATLLASVVLSTTLLGSVASAQVAAGGAPPPPKAVNAGPEWPPPIPRYRLLATSVLGGSFNSEGIEEQVRFGVQSLLYRSSSPVFRDNFVFVGVNPRVNPTATRLGPSIEIQPLSVFNLKMNLEFADYYGSLGSVQSYASPLADFSEETRSRNKELGRNYGTTGARISITPFVQLKVGPIALRNRFTLEYIAIGLRGGDRVFYETAYDTLVAGKGTILSDDLDLFYVKDLSGGGFFSHGRVAAGVRYTMFKPLFTTSDFQAGDDRSKERDEMHRVGPLVAFSMFDNGYSRFHEPTIVAMAQWYAAHRNRTGRDMDQAVPYLVLAFIFQSDLWTSADSVSP